MRPASSFMDDRTWSYIREIIFFFQTHFSPAIVLNYILHINIDIEWKRLKANDKKDKVLQK
ncbi:hypothetical protein J2750_000907 [Methanococcoides alaskense]|uniref:Uncharacterized protein n=1 Tax=Methanococcoides alaskense TaxID=325778 RepID=A0AA90TYT2_9EURY|nr:hypothetical protein [Methanococcoides alaskense]